MNKTKIEWCDMTWNPVTGCLHDCEYCYAKRIAERFKPKSPLLHDCSQPGNGLHEIRYKSQPYKYGFAPTLHSYRLGNPIGIAKPKRIFVCSMADLFGDWVPDEWISEVMKACAKAPQHTYLFLTKNPKRYGNLNLLRYLPPKFILGTTVTNAHDFMKVPLYFDYLSHSFLSIEPLLGDLAEYINFSKYSWVIVGAQTGPSPVKPKHEWVQSIIVQCREAGVPVFLKDNLNWPEKIQEFPEVSP